MGNKQYTGVSLFTGAGGMDVGFERAGIKVIFANELMKEAAETYVANHPGCNMVNDDIYNQLPQMGQYIGADFVFGGPPCQGFSIFKGNKGRIYTQIGNAVPCKLAEVVAKAVISYLESEAK